MWKCNSFYGKFVAEFWPKFASWKKIKNVEKCLSTFSNLLNFVDRKKSFLNLLQTSANRTSALYFFFHIGYNCLRTGIAKNASRKTGASLSQNSRAGEVEAASCVA